MDDRAIVARQLGRPPRAFGRVAVRCPYGLPAVTEQLPYDSEGEPFPTTYYLTCPHLVSAIARVEAAGGVERWSVASQDDAELAASLARATEEQRRVRRELAGTARGADDGASLDSGSAARARPRTSSACTRTWPSRSPARATSWVSGSSPRSSSRGRPIAAVLTRLSRSVRARIPSARSLNALLRSRVARTEDRSDCE